LQFAGCEQGIAGRSYRDSFNINIDRLNLTKKFLDDVVCFRGKFMHTGMDQEMEAWTNYENLLGILERTLLAMLGWKGLSYIDKLSGYSLKTLNF
jgi:hypothetical protein